MDANLASIANAIRGKIGATSALSFPTDFVSALESIADCNEGIVADTTITVASTISNIPTTVYTDPILKTLDWYLICMYYIGSDTTSSMTLELFACTDISRSAIIYRNNSGTIKSSSGSSGSNAYLVVDDAGNIVIKAYSSTEGLIVGPYRLLILGGI